MCLSVCLSVIFQKKSKLHYHIAVIINYLGHCISLGALLVAFILFMRLRWVRASAARTSEVQIVWN